jgi:DnaJ-class molecular chaperone
LQNRKRIQVLYDAYAFLGVNSDDPDSVIERAFRELAKEYHPDKRGDVEKFVQLGMYMEIIRAHREGKAYFKEETLLLGYQNDRQ